MSIFEIFVLITTVLYILYKYGTEFYDHWDRKGINYLKPPFPFIGNSKDLVMKNISAAENLINVYNSFPAQRIQISRIVTKRIWCKSSLQVQAAEMEFLGRIVGVARLERCRNTATREDLQFIGVAHRFGGIFMFRRPILLLRDPELIRNVLVKDFDHFFNRALLIDPEADPLFGKNLSVLKDQLWKDMRTTLTPVFTSAKMKNMLTLINVIGNQMTNYLDGLIENQMKSNHPDGNLLSMEFKDFFRRFTIDVIATCAFGVEIDSLKDRENQFYKMGVNVVNLTGIVFVKYILCFMFPNLVKALKMTVFGKEETRFYRDLVQKSIKIRQEKNIVRPDLIHLFMQLRSEKKKLIDVTDDEITAQAVVFFLAGFETVATSLSFTAYELAINPDFQARLQEEIDGVIKQEGGITYDGIMHKMKYLDMVITESLRKWPPTILTNRTVTRRYVISKTHNSPELILEKGEDIWIPIIACHRNPEFFPNPEVFDPERFSDENKDKVIPFTYLPFGTGPRGCIGNRFGIMELKTCMVHLLRKYTFKVIPRTQIPLNLSKTNQSLTAEKGFWLGLKPRDVK